MPNYNQYGGVSRQDRNRIQQSGRNEKLMIRNYLFLGIGIVLLFVFIMIKFGLVYSGDEQTVTAASYAPWLIVVASGFFLVIGLNGLNNQNADYVAKRQQKAERRAQRKAEKASRKQR